MRGKEERRRTYTTAFYLESRTLVEYLYMLRDSVIGTIVVRVTFSRQTLSCQGKSFTVSQRACLV